MIYNYLEGHTAKLIQSLFREEIKTKSSFIFEPVRDINSHEIQSIDNLFYYFKGGNKYLMFAYLKNYNINKYGSPKYHTCICETREIYSGFVFASHMPVEIQNTEDYKYHNLYLPLCNNCRIILMTFAWELNNGNVSWEEFLLMKAGNGELADDHQRANGYSVYWKQISYAYRNLHKFKCEKCGVDLSRHDYQYYLEVHHKDHNKMNNAKENLQCLCVKCHSRVDAAHERNYSFGTNLLKLHAFRNRD
jgi:hypothetical protein